MKLFNKINMNNKYIFFSLIGLMVFVLTCINNYSFYNYVKIRDNQEIRVLAKNIHYKINTCMEENQDKEKCIQNIKLYLNELKPYGIVTLSTIKYNNTKPRHLFREAVRIPKYLEYNKAINTQLYISKHSIPNILLTVYRSMTFSLMDILDKVRSDGIKDTIEWYINHKIYLRSNNVIIFIILAYFLIRLLKIKQQQYNQTLLKQDTHILNLLKNIEKSEEQKENLEDIVNKLKSNNINLHEKMQQYSKIINPPIDALKYEDILSLDPESIIFKCRKVIEKIITQNYNKHIGNSDFINLDTMIKKLRNEGKLNKKSVGYANTIKAFGNISAHPDIQNPIEFTQEDAKIISNALILFIEEMEQNI